MGHELGHHRTLCAGPGAGEQRQSGKSATQPFERVIPTKPTSTHTEPLDGDAAFNRRAWRDFVVPRHVIAGAGSQHADVVTTRGQPLGHAAGVAFGTTEDVGAVSCYDEREPERSVRHARDDFITGSASPHPISWSYT